MVRKIGVVTDEMITLNGSRTGGFGWAAQTLRRELLDHPELGGAPLMLTRNQSIRSAMGRSTRIDARSRAPDLLALKDDVRRDPAGLARLALQRFRLLITIDFRPIYAPFLRTLRNVPVVLWVRDPKGEAEYRQLETLREPGFPDVAPAGTDRIDTQRAAEVLADRRARDACRVAVVSPFLRERVAGAYGLDPAGSVHLPNIHDPVEVRSADRAGEPTVLMLGRLDPVKRVWVALELAKRLPHVRFVIAGAEHAGSRWRPITVPDNVDLVGEVFGEAKDAWLRRAWVLLNTSIHEGLPVTFQEALAYRVPIVSYLDPEKVPSRFGYAAGPEPGDGLGGVSRLQEGLEALLQDHERRDRLGHEGQGWVRDTHSRNRFHEAWRRLVSELPGR
jgi:glycosyltransferase involved in cell wall biosynthesis